MKSSLLSSPLPSLPSPPSPLLPSPPLSTPLLSQEIDDSHPCVTFKYLKNKPIGTLKDDQFLHIVQAEEDGLLTSSIRIDQEGSYGSPYFEEVKQLFYRVSS